MRGRATGFLARELAIVRGGQPSGDFDDTVPAQWLLWASLALGRATEDEVKVGRMTIEQATRAMHQGLLRLLGVTMHRTPGAVAEARWPRLHRTVAWRAWNVPG